MDDIIKLKPLEDRILIDTLETSWQMPRLLIKDPSLIEDPEIAERAKAEMVRFNTYHSNNGRTDGRNEMGIPIGETFASFGTMQNEAYTILTRASKYRSPIRLTRSNPTGSLP